MRGWAGSARSLWLPLCAGLIFVALFEWRYAGIDPSFYQFRDDGIITLSHARNWVDYGFIGVNPSGERVEAYSAPAQMLLYAATYSLSGLHFRTFMGLQTILCTFAIGFLLAKFFAGRPWFGLAACIAAALALTRLSSFMVWHGSGMENALTHVLLLWTVWLLYRFARDERVDLRWAVVPFLASISRVESIFHIAPLLLVFCIHWRGRVGDRQARRFAMCVAGLWVLFNLWRFLYFGTLLPNTAVAQGISVGDRLMELATLNPIYLDQSFGLARTLFGSHGGYLLLLVLPFVVLRPRDDRIALQLALGGTLVLTHLSAPFVFGPARLDVTRTTTPIALFVVLAVCAAAHQWRYRRSDAYLLSVTVVLVFLIHEYSAWSPYRVCCEYKDFEQVRLAFERIGREEGIARPTVANADLGVVSWPKTVNVVDMGLLGSPLFARLQDHAALNDYFFGHAAPDMIETHGFWTCKYKTLLTDPRFRAMYVEASEPGKQMLPCKNLLVPNGIWVRRDVLRPSASRERRLIDELQRDPSAKLLEAELLSCQAISAAGGDCSYVARSAYRVLPELRARGDAARLKHIFQQSRSAGFDLSLVTGSEDARAFLKAIDYLERKP